MIKFVIMIVIVIVMVRVRARVIVAMLVILSAAAGRAHSGYLHLFDLQLSSGEQVDIGAAARTQRHHIVEHELAGARAAAAARDDLVDLEARAGERRVLRARLEREAQRVGEHGHESSDLQPHADHARVAETLSDRRHDALGERQLVHGSDLGRGALVSMGSVDTRGARPNRKCVLASASQPDPGGASRVGLRVRGVVQGVGFRPTVHRLATELGLGGSVRNDAEGVWIELEGDPSAIARFVERLKAERPARARIDAIEPRALAADRAPAPHAFRIVMSSADGESRARLPADGAPCDACLGELADPHDRRYRYPFINCTDCGPRYTIARDVPYDRARTTMAPFALCDDCRREYEDPSSRRFHAEPNACGRCGPRLEFLDGGERCRGEEALAAAVRRIGAGGIVAIKGAGGFLLAVDARNEAAVARLRARKRRPHKPLALMARDLATIESIAHLSA
ncbi:MAG: hypF, partial [bacterium]|nr:hypF [bacterium]